jgi:hypothetical protein
VGFEPRPVEPQSRQECAACALRLVKHAFRARAINLGLPRSRHNHYKDHYSALMRAIRKNSIRELLRTFPHLRHLNLSQRTALFITRGIYRQVSEWIVSLSEWIAALTVFRPRPCPPRTRDSRIPRKTACGARPVSRGPHHERVGPTIAISKVEQGEVAMKIRTSIKAGPTCTTCRSQA